MPSVDADRGRAGTRAREAAETSRRETRRRLLVAAGELFAERGYAASTVSAIAERAEVSLQTLYAAWGSKRALLRAYMEAALSGSESGVDPHEWVSDLGSHIDAHAGGDADPRTQLSGMAREFRRIADRAGLGWRLYRDAAASDPEIAADWDALQALRRQTFVGLLARLPASALRPGLKPAAAADTAWAIASPQTHELLVGHGGYTPDELEVWVAETLIAALLRPPEK